MIERHHLALRSAAIAALASLALAACDAGSQPAADGVEDGGMGFGRGDAGTQDAATTAQGNESSNGNSAGPPFDGGSGATTDPSQGGGGTGPEPNPPGVPLVGQVCPESSVCLEIGAGSVDKIDLLFMIDDSNSMQTKQAALREQFPALLRALTTGDNDGDGVSEAPAAKSLHLGVVSSDLGLVGISGIDKCTGLGDDGVMRNEPSSEIEGCASSYPRFLSYQAGSDDPDTGATDLACIATLGTEGCGFEQQLESALKAVWPADDDRITFLPDPQGFGAVGQGDNGGMNAGFLRNDPIEGVSLIAVVIVTDEEDCSSKDTRHFLPPAFLDPNDPADAQLLMQGLNVRCNFNPQNLFSKERYINGLKALRPGNEDLVVFGAIIGVPPDSVRTLPADYATNDTAREAFYDQILSHPNMLPMVDTKGTESPDDDSMTPSCVTDGSKAYPPPRIVEVARGFGANGIVQSICEDDLGPAVEAIEERIQAHLGLSCLQRPLVRDADDRVGCDVLWALPAPGQAAAGTPTTCSELPFLSAADPDRELSDGGELCQVAQLAVPTQAEPSGDGWYYDDFSDEAAMECSTVPASRIAFSAGAEPPSGVRVILDCGQ